MGFIYNNAICKKIHAHDLNWIPMYCRCSNPHVSQVFLRIIPRYEIAGFGHRYNFNWLRGWVCTPHVNVGIVLFLFLYNSSNLHAAGEVTNMRTSKSHDGSMDAGVWFPPGGGTPSVRVSRDVPPTRPPFSPQVHPLVGYSNVKHIPVGYHFFRSEPLSLCNICEISIFSHSFWVIFVKILFSGWG